MKKTRYLTAALCAVVLLCGLTIPAYAGGGEEWSDVEVSTREPRPRRNRLSLPPGRQNPLPTPAAPSLPRSRRPRFPLTMPQRRIARPRAAWIGRALIPPS